MRYASLPTLLLGVSASLCLATLQKRMPGLESTLIGRGLPVAAENCTRSTPCHECYGDGYVVCDNAGCFNPDEGQQCCKNGLLCVAWDDGCCDGWGGPGESGTSGAVPLATATSTSALPESTGWSCTRFQGVEDCCQGGGPDTHWCAEEFPNTVCYNSKLQKCCSEGTVCEGKDCCDIVSASEVTPWATLDSAKKSTASGETAAPTATTGPESKSGAAATGTGTATTAETATSSGAAARALVTPFAQGLAGIGAVGMGLIL